MMLLLLSIVLIALVMAAMSVGVVLSNKCLRGSCGGPEMLGPDGTPLSCETCPMRHTEHCEHA